MIKTHKQLDNALKVASATFEFLKHMQLDNKDIQEKMIKIYTLAIDACDIAGTALAGIDPKKEKEFLI